MKNRITRCWIFLFYLLTEKAYSADPTLTCQARLLDMDTLVDVKVIPYVIPVHNVATAQWAFGYPTIAIDSNRFAKLPKLSQQFIYYHECAHLQERNMNEEETDCYALRLMRKKRSLQKIYIRKLVDQLAVNFGLSKRWLNLLECNEKPVG